MKKSCLLVILILNLSVVAVTGIVVYKHFFYLKPGTMKEQTQAQEPLNETAKLNIVSTPAGAKVFVNGYYKGITPVKFEVVSVKDNGNYSLVLIKENYLRWEKNIEIHAGDFKKYNIELADKKETGRLGIEN